MVSRTYVTAPDRQSKTQVKLSISGTVTTDFITINLRQIFDICPSDQNLSYM